MKRCLTWVLALCCTPLAAHAQGKYSVPAPRSVTAAWEAARESLADDAIDGAANAIELLLDTADGELVEIRPREWVGARQAARELIGAPTSALARAVATRREAKAQAELRALRSAGPRLDARGRAALVTLPWQHPGTLAALEARLFAGDLAFEGGDVERARELWQAGVDAAAEPQGPVPQALAARLAATAATPAAQPAAPIERFDQRIEGRWTQYLPPGPRDRYIDHGDLRPVALGRRVWVNTGLRVMNFLATSGQLLWDSGEPTGWEALSSWKRRELFRGVALPDLTNRVASDGRYVVAALQLPFTENKNDNIDGLTITVSLPERRLFAFDAKSGAPLWDHAPTTAQRVGAAALAFPERARIAGPPEIWGDLVIVPSYELVGRINLFVTAYDLYSGVLVWNRLVVSGQTRVNLFGEHEAEFNAAPLTLQNGRVLVCSNLGVVAALDLATGQPLWTEEYRRYELPRTNGYYTPSAQRRWHNGPPLVAGERFCIAPIDSPDMLFGNLESGVIAQIEGNDLEDIASAGLGRDRVDLDHPVRLTDTTLWVGGDQLCSFALEWRADDIDAVLRFPPLSTPGPNDAYNSPSPRARVLDAGGRLYVPTEYRLVAVDPATGATEDLGPLDSDMWRPGNLAIADGRMIVLTDEFLYGWVNWDAVIVENLARLDAALEPELRAQLTLDLGRAYLSRWEARGTDAGDLDEARDQLMAREVDAWVDAGYVGMLELRDLRFGLLNAEAEVQMLRDQPRRANDSLAAALAFAPSATARIAVRFHQLEVLGPATAGESGWRTKARGEILQAFVDDHPREVLDDETATELGVQYEFDSVLAQLDPALVELGDALGPDLFTKVPLGFLGLAALAEARERTAVRPSEWEAALALWHAALWDFGALAAPDDARGYLELGDWIDERIDRTLERAEGRAGYQAFEVAAEERVAKAENLPPAERVAALGAVVSRYPHSAAAARVNRQMIDLLVAELESAPTAEDFEHLARLAIPLMDADADRAAHARLAFARGAAARGHVELAYLFAQRLGEVEPRMSAVFTLPDIDWPSAAARRTFHGPSSTGRGNFSVRLGNYEAIGAIAVAPGADSDGDELMLAGSSSGELLAFRGGSRGELDWTFPIGNYAGAPWPERVLSANVGEARVLCVQADNGVVGLDPRNGGLRWDHVPLDARPHAIQIEGGLLTVLWVGDGGSYRLQALSANDGVELWSRPLSDELNDYRGSQSARILRAGTRLVVMAEGRGFAPRVLDVTTGRELGQLELAADTSSGDLEHAWVSGGHLFVPRVLGGTGDRANVIHAYDLTATAGGPAYTLALDVDQEIAGVLHAPSGTYLWLNDVEHKPGAANSIVQVNAELGALRRVATLDPNELPAGLELGEALTLDADFLITAIPPNRGGELRLRGIELPLGPLWSAKVPAPARAGWQLDDGLLPAALTSSGSVTLLYAQVSNDPSRGQEVHALVLDRQTGRSQEDRVLSARLGRMGNIQLGGIDDELFLFGEGTWGSDRGRLEILIPQSNDSR